MHSALLLACVLVPDARLAQAPALPQAPLAQVLPRAHVKTCPCSPLCTCGCNAGEPCTCPRGPVLRPAASLVLPAWQPATTWAPALAPMMPAYSFPAGGGLRSGGC